MKVLLLSMLTLSFCVAGACALRCYECIGSVSTSINDWCNDPFDSTDPAAQASIQTCSGECVVFYSKIGDLQGFVRECSNVTVPDCLNACHSALGITSCQYCCSEDLCNSTSIIMFDLLAAIAKALSAWYRSV